jgi:hypothetical protein
LQDYTIQVFIRRILFQAHGRGALESRLIAGYALNNTRASQVTLLPFSVFQFYDDFLVENFPHFII